MKMMSVFLNHYSYIYCLFPKIIKMTLICMNHYTVVGYNNLNTCTHIFYGEKNRRRGGGGTGRD